MTKFNKAPYDELVENWIRDKEFPAAVLDIALGDKFRFRKAYGAYATNDGDTRPATLDTLFDMASLTKVVATLPAVMKLVEAGTIDLDEPVKTYMPRFRHEAVTIRHLLTHTSGLAADLPYQPRSAVGRDVVGEICAQDLLFPPGSKELYSDGGMILLALIVSNLTGEPFDHFIEKTIFKPLGMEHACFNPQGERKERCASTEFVEGRYVAGEVHDEKAFHLGGVAGSAGLFATADDIQKYARAWLDSAKTPILQKETRRLCMEAPLGTRGLGWQIYNGANELSCGKGWSPGSFGHTGFTGTSVWIDPERELSVVFLTNVVQFGRKHNMSKIRPLLHETIYASV